VVAKVNAVTASEIPEPRPMGVAILFKRFNPREVAVIGT
jgi:hypothetical protein